MGHANLGLKYTCVSCAARFYDLNREPAVCPKCQAEQPKPKPRVFAPSRGGTKRWPGQAPASQTAIPAEAEAEAADEAPELLDDADVIEPDVLDDDDDDDADAVVPNRPDEV